MPQVTITFSYEHSDDYLEFTGRSREVANRADREKAAVDPVGFIEDTFNWDAIDDLDITITEDK